MPSATCGIVASDSDVRYCWSVGSMRSWAVSVESTSRPSISNSVHGIGVARPDVGRGPCHAPGVRSYCWHFPIDARARQDRLLDRARGRPGRDRFRIGQLCPRDPRAEQQEEKRNSHWMTRR